MFGSCADLCCKKKIEFHRKITANRRIVPDIPDDYVAVVPAAEADKEVAVACKAEIRDANFVHLVAASHHALLVIPHDHHSLQQCAA